jgi:alkanesulfonate monooxygenase SsuD/methylene tetrahydromethanopterin reductase-like flavin-dependent oxidoreductase (luciferase family)
MKAAIFTSVPYMGPAPRGTWPVAGAGFSAEVAARSVELSLDQFELADQLGFDWVTLAEHHFAPMSLTPNPMVMAGALTQRVKRARIALLGANIPIQNPVRVAEEFAMLDTMTGGRVIAGMLRGTPNEFVTYGTNPGETRALYEEGVEIVLKAWDEPEPFGWQGEHYQYRVISVWPQPLQAPRPPVYLSINSPESGAFAARMKVGGGVSYAPTNIAAKLYQNYRDQAAQAGWQPEREQYLYRCFIHVADTDAQADRDIDEVYWGRAGGLFNVSQRVSEALAAAEGKKMMPNLGRMRPIFCGSPDTVAQQMAEFVEQTGAGSFDLTFQGPGLPHETLMHSLDLFGTRVIPQIRDL